MSGTARPAPPAAPERRQKATQQKAVGRRKLFQPRALELSSGCVEGLDRTVIYGTGGIGKSTLAAYLPAPLFIDVEAGTRRINITREVARTWEDLRSTLAAIEADPPKGIKTIVVDTISRAQDLAQNYVVENYTTEKGQAVESIEGFPYGKGWQYIAEEMLLLLADLDRIADHKGLSVCLIAHEVATNVPNAAGEDFLRFEPNLYLGDKRGHGNIREYVKTWADHVLYVCYDIHVQDGKALGSGTRTVFTAELPTHIAKSRTNPGSFDFELSNPAEIWASLKVV